MLASDEEHVRFCENLDSAIRFVLIDMLLF